MLRMMLIFAVAGASVADVYAAVLCSRRNGKVVVRSDQCRAKETAVDIAALGVVGPAGPAGKTGPVSEYVRADVTLRGVYHVSGVGSGPGSAATGAISFGLTLDRSLPPEIGPWPLPPIVHFVGANAVAPGECAGSAEMPEAAPGYLCVYESGRLNVAGVSVCRTSLLNVVDDDEACPGADPFGASIQVVPDAPGPFLSFGVWAARGF